MSKKTELNELVLKFQADKAAGKRENTADSQKLVELAKELTRFQMCKKEYKNVDFDDVLVNTLKSYKGDKGSDFVNYLGRALKYEMYDTIKAEAKKESLEVFSLDDNTDERDAHEAIKGEDMEDFEKISNLLEVMLGVVKIRQNMLKNSPKVCWDTYFFTENVASSITTDDNAYLYVLGNSKRYLSTISLEFINSYTSDECCSIKDIKNATLKPEDVYRHNESDNPCGYDLINEVYEQYFDTSKSAVTQNRDKYYLRIREALT